MKLRVTGYSQVEYLYVLTIRLNNDIQNIYSKERRQLSQTIKKNCVKKYRRKVKS